MSFKDSHYGVCIVHLCPLITFWLLSATNLLQYTFSHSNYATVYRPGLRIRKLCSVLPQFCFMACSKSPNLLTCSFVQPGKKMIFLDL